MALVIERHGSSYAGTPADGRDPTGLLSSSAMDANGNTVLILNVHKP